MGIRVPRRRDYRRKENDGAYATLPRAVNMTMDLDRPLRSMIVHEQIV